MRAKINLWQSAKYWRTIQSQSRLSGRWQTAARWLRASSISWHPITSMIAFSTTTKNTFTPILIGYLKKCWSFTRESLEFFVFPTRYSCSNIKTLACQVRPVFCRSLILKNKDVLKSCLTSKWRETSRLIIALPCFRMKRVVLLLEGYLQRTMKFLTTTFYQIKTMNLIMKLLPSWTAHDNKQQQ